MDTGWITTTLETITPKHRDLQKICINVEYVSAEDKINPKVAWSDLDHLLMQFWESRFTRTELGFTKPPKSVGGMMGLAKFLLPELTKGGIIDLVEEPDSDF